MTAYVATFYSFKGGVGCTTLLVNVAHVLAERGERVLLWDLDLEAPGIHQFPGLEPPERLWQSGFLEWLEGTPPCPSPEPSAAWPSETWLNDLARRVYPARGDHRGSILVLPALGTLANLGRAYSAVDWHRLFIERPEHGLHLFRRVRDALVAHFEPTFLLIDAPTGISDLGGLLTGFVPNCTVLVGNYGIQSTQGLRSVYLALDRFATERAQSEPHRPRKLDRLLVASPVPVSPASLERGRERWSSGFPGVAPRSQIEIPLIESLLHAEDVLVHSAPSSDAARAYRAVTERLLELRAAHARAEARRDTFDHPGRLTSATRMLRDLGLEIVTTRGMELTARERTPVGDRTYHVVYLEGTVGATARTRDLLERLRARRRSPEDQLLMIADDARDDARRAAEAAGVALRTTGELVERVVDLRAYALQIRRAFEDSELARAYVAPHVVVDGRAEDALGHAMRWATSEGSPLYLLLGEAGSGKTSLVKRLAYELAVRAALVPTAPVPVLLSLRRAGPGATLASLLQEHLASAIGWYGNPDAILHLHEIGRIILLCDGLDELAISAGEAAHRLRELAWSTARRRPTATGRRMLLAMRSSAVPADRSAEETFDEPVIATMAPLAAPQIASFLRHRLGSAQAEIALQRIRSRPELEALASAPLGLRLLADAVSDRKIGDDRVTLAALYEHQAERWIAPRDSGLSREARIVLLEQLAAELWSSRASEVAVPPLSALLRKQGWEASDDELDRALRSAPFLTRSDDARYGFSNLGFLEYWLARYVIRCLRSDLDALRAALASAPVSASFTALLSELAANMPEAAFRFKALAVGSYTPMMTENAARIAVALGASLEIR